MHQFLHGSDAAFADLEARARRACFIAHDQDLPPGCDPPRARIGFEMRDDAAVLLVDRGVTYPGAKASVRDWFAAGEKTFSDFPELRRWLRDELSPCYNVAALPSHMEENPILSSPAPEALTDLAQVARAQRITRAPILDEDRLYEQLAQRVRGQEEPLRTLARRVVRHLARVQPRRPLTLFAIGPTGVGKTTAAITLPEALHALDPRLEYGFLRLDMGEYQERHRVSQLLGTPQGYVGYGDGAQLSDTLAARPRTVVLFDEIEKAHPWILRTLMNAMDAGRLSSAARMEQGREIDCRAAVFLFTSNLNADEVLAELARRDAFAQPMTVDTVCRERLRRSGTAPELVGRVGGFLVFRPLSPSASAEIVTLAIAHVAAEYGVHVAAIDPAVVVHLLECGGSDRYGARPAEYAIDAELGGLFARCPTDVLIRIVVADDDPPYACLPVEERASR